MLYSTPKAFWWKKIVLKRCYHDIKCFFVFWTLKYVTLTVSLWHSDWILLFWSLCKYFNLCPIIIQSWSSLSLLDQLPTITAVKNGFINNKHQYHTQWLVFCRRSNIQKRKSWYSIMMHHHWCLTTYSLMTWANRKWSVRQQYKWCIKWCYCGRARNWCVLHNSNSKLLENWAWARNSLTKSQSYHGHVTRMQVTLKKLFLPWNFSRKHWWWAALWWKHQYWWHFWECRNWWWQKYRFPAWKRLPKCENHWKQSLCLQSRLPSSVLFQSKPWHLLITMSRPIQQCQQMLVFIKHGLIIQGKETKQGC